MPSLISDNESNCPGAYAQYNAQHDAAGAMFVGPRGENIEYMTKYITSILQQQKATREAFSENWGDGVSITKEMQESEAFTEVMDRLQEQLDNVNSVLRTWAIPFWSPRYHAHMTHDANLPGMLGYITTMLFNPNNIAVEGSGVVTLYEEQACLQLCGMLGYNIKTKISTPLMPSNTPPKAWGHITSGGTVANIESMWSARNLKFYPLAIRDAMENGGPLSFIAETFRVHTSAEMDHLEPLYLFKDLTTWQLLNLRSNTILDIPMLLLNSYNITSVYLEKVMKEYGIQTRGKDVVEHKWGIVKPPQYLAPTTMHYSWPKGAALTGIGSQNIVGVTLDLQARISIPELKEHLDRCLSEEQAVYAVVAVMGTTEEGSVDPMEKIIELRSDYEKRGMTFLVHADAAWGGYFCTTFSDTNITPISRRGRMGEERYRYVAKLKLPADVERDMRAMKDCDSVTIDPHKTGYVPYPGGALCYRDERMKYLVTWTTPYIEKKNSGEVATAVEIGKFGIEGSKPGASGVATYISNMVIGLDPLGYGGLLGEVMFTRARLSAHWATLATEETPFTLVPFNLLPAESDKDSTPEKVAAQKQFIRDRILGRPSEDLINDQIAMDLLTRLGSSLNVNALACNFKIGGEINDDVEEANHLNSRIANRLSIRYPATIENCDVTRKTPQDIPIWMASTEFEQHVYGDCATIYKKRLGLTGPLDLFVLRNVVMSPFATQGDFIQSLSNEFETVVREESEIAIRRATEDPTVHKFLIQGTERLYVTYTSGFHNENHRRQMILSITLPKNVHDVYLEKRHQNLGLPFFLVTSKKVRLSQIAYSATGDNIHKFNLIAGAGLDTSATPIASNIEVTIMSTIKNRSLRSRYRDIDYPANFMPFYIYGDLAEAHIDHILLRAPNIQLSADNVSLTLPSSRPAKRKLTNALRHGAIMHITNVSEASMQPFPEISSESSSKFFFRRGSEFRVEIWPDVRGPNENGPGLAKVEGKPLMSQRMELSGGVFISNEKLNRDPFPEVRKGGKRYRERMDQVRKALGGM